MELQELPPITFTWLTDQIENLLTEGSETLDYDAVVKRGVELICGSYSKVPDSVPEDGYRVVSNYTINRDHFNDPYFITGKKINQIHDAFSSGTPLEYSNISILKWLIVSSIINNTIRSLSNVKILPADYESFNSLVSYLTGGWFINSTKEMLARASI